LPGLSAPVTVSRDSHGIPLIEAASAADAYVALGFVHAQDRLWQMEVMRRVGAGRLSEVVGARAIDIDRLMRTLGPHRLAEESLSDLEPETRAALDSYAAGVNAFLATHRGALPPEFILLDLKPEPWRPADSIVWGKLMAMQLSVDWREELLRARLAERLGTDAVEELWPADDAPRRASLAPPQMNHAWRLPEILDDVLGKGASNAWAVAPTRTATGRPILATDPHLGAQLPSQWYLARIRAPGLDLGGATAPGVPFLIIGHNGALGWAFTSSQADVEDLVAERTAPGDPTHYTGAGGERRAFATRTETIRVKAAAPIEMVVRASQNGPIVSDELKAKDRLEDAGTVLALAAPYLRAPDRSPDALRRMNAAASVAALEAALERFDALQQFVTYAHANGAIGFVAPGALPVRRTGDGYWPANGTLGPAWTGRVPHAQLPRSADPAQGFIVNANSRPESSAIFLARTWEEPYRLARAREILAAQRRHTPEDSAALQADTLSLAARDILAVALPMAGAPGDKLQATALDALKAWDGTMAADKVEPLVYTAWMRALARRLFEDELGADFPAYWSTHPRVLIATLAGAGRWCDDARTSATEACAAQVQGALSDAVADLKRLHGADPSRWRWGKAHTVALKHTVFGRIPILSTLWGKSLELGGDSWTLLRAGTRFSADATAPFRAYHVASLRMIVDVGGFADSRFLIPTGQSGHPLSPHFLDLAERWRDFAYLRLPQEAGARALRLVPAP
ncbi:MAG: penicillin acylase family protein, partial [Alphaproteobacteria bacterium]|nr:penicillin acylase family protein [Alphaproteobacteria bacterium]